MSDRCHHDMERGTCAICLGIGVRKPQLPIAEQRASQLFDFASENPSFTKPQACQALGWSEGVFAGAVRELRRILSGDDINLVVDNQSGDWIYKLVGNLAGALPWATLRLKSVESQLMTIADVTSSIVNATRANSFEGKRARLIAAQMNILQLQLSNLKE